MTTLRVATSTSMTPSQGEAPGLPFRFDEMPKAILDFGILPFLTVFIPKKSEDGLTKRDGSEIASLLHCSKFWKRKLTAQFKEQLFDFQKKRSKTITKVDLLNYNLCTGNNYTSLAIQRLKYPGKFYNLDHFNEIAELREFFPKLRSLEIVKFRIPLPSYSWSKTDLAQRLQAIQPPLAITLIEEDAPRIEPLNFELLAHPQSTTCSSLGTAICIVGLAALTYVSPWAGLAGLCAYGAYKFTKLSS